MFGNSPKTLISTKRQLSCLLQTLKELVPNEPAAHLKVTRRTRLTPFVHPSHSPSHPHTSCTHQAHLRSPPRGLAKCHEAVHGYLSAVKNRLKELNVRPAPSLAHVPPASPTPQPPRWYHSCVLHSPQILFTSTSHTHPHFTSPHLPLPPHKPTWSRTMLISLMHRQQEEEAIRYHGNGDPSPPPMPYTPFPFTCRQPMET